MPKTVDASGPALAYSIDDFCALSGLGRSYVYEAIARGDLEARKAGRRTLILRMDGQRYLESLPSTSPVPPPF